MHPIPAFNHFYHDNFFAEAWDIQFSRLYRRPQSYIRVTEIAHELRLQAWESHQKECLQGILNFTASLELPLF